MKHHSPSVQEFAARELLIVRRENHALRAKIDRLLEPARAIFSNAVLAESNTCEIALEDLQRLGEALREWGQ